MINDDYLRGKTLHCHLLLKYIFNYYMLLNHLVFSITYIVKNHFYQLLNDVSQILYFDIY